MSNKYTKSITPRNQPQPTNKNSTNTTMCRVSFVLSAMDSLTRHSQTQPTTGRSKRIALIRVDCLLNHLSKVIIGTPPFLFSRISYPHYYYITQDRFCQPSKKIKILFFLFGLFFFILRLEERGFLGCGGVFFSFLLLFKHEHKPKRKQCAGQEIENAVKLQFGGQCPQTMRSKPRLSTADHWALSTGRYDPLVVLSRLINAIVGDGFPVPAVKCWFSYHFRRIRRR